MVEPSEQQVGKNFIVVGVDGSEASIDALRWAVGQAKLTGARLEVIAAWEVPWMIMVSPTKVDDDYFREVRERLDPAIKEGLSDAEGVDVTVRIVEWESAPSLIDASDGADMLVIGSHRYGTVKGMHLGSVASYCAHHARCPVLIHRHA